MFRTIEKQIKLWNQSAEQRQRLPTVTTTKPTSKPFSRAEIAELHVKEAAIAWYFDKQMKKQRIMPQFKIPQGKRQVVELSTQRSGSTLLMSVFNMIENAFVLPEPHNMWDVHLDALPSRMKTGARPPDLHELFSCSFVESDAFNWVNYSGTMHATMFDGYR